MSNKYLVTVPGAVLFSLLMWSGVSLGQGAGEPAEKAAVVNEGEASAGGDGMSKAVVALAAALAVGLCAIATGIAQSRIGAAACGTIAERPEASGTVILLVAIPETMVILGFVVAVVIVFVL